MRRTLLIFVLVFSLTLGCAGNPVGNSPKTELTKIRLPMGYIPSVQYAPFYVAAQKGYFRQTGLDVQFDYASETDGVALVGSNEIPFSLVSGEQVLLARAQGLPVVYVMAWWHNYPVGVVSLKGNGIVNPADLRGKKIGLPGLFGASYIGLRALLSAGGLTENDVTLDSIGFNQVEALVSGRDDAVVIYVNNEPIQLEHKGYPVDVIRVADYVTLASNGLLTNETTIANNPKLIKGMVQAVLRGIAFTLDHSNEAYQICENYVEGLASANQSVQRKIFDTSLEFWRADQLGYSQLASWENMQTVLLNMGMLSSPIDLSRAFTNDFVPKE